MKCIEQIDVMRRAIQTGKMGPGQMVGTESAFSQKWKLARNTVRRGIDQLVHEGLLERRPGKGLFVREPHTSTKTIQLIVPNLSWPYVVQTVHGVQREAREFGIHVQVYDAHSRMELDLEMIRRLPKSGCHGAIIISLHHPRFNEILFQLKTEGFPFVLVDQELQDFEISSVREDSYRGGYIVGEKLAELGHERIAFVGPIRMIQDRLNGFRDALLDAGIVFDRSLVVDIGGDSDLIRWLEDSKGIVNSAIKEVLTGKERPSAIFDGSGDIAPEIYRVAKQLRLKIPEDLSIVTFDDPPMISYLEPEVARLTHCWPEIGKTAFDMLYQLMAQHNSSQKQLAKRGKRPKAETPSTSPDPLDFSKTFSPPVEGDKNHRVLPVSWHPAPSIARLEQSS